MALVHSLEKSGQLLFKYRGQIPVVLFAAAIPTIYCTDYFNISLSEYNLYTTLCILISLAGFIFRAYAIGTTPKGTSGRNTEKQVAESLNTKGIYSIVRHPLYVGNYFMWIGIVAFTFNLWFVLVVSLAYWIYYERIMFAEERFLERKFGQQYIDWSNKVPAFVPKFSRFEKGPVPFSLKTVLRREYSGFLATVVSFVFVDLVRLVFTYIHYDRPLNTLEIQTKYYLILAITFIIVFILRSLKKYTTVLEEEDRS